jgi:hypothetical protein
LSFLDQTTPDTAQPRCARKSEGIRLTRYTFGMARKDTCDCGAPKDSRAARCQACYREERRRRWSKPPWERRTSDVREPARAQQRYTETCPQCGAVKYVNRAAPTRGVCFRCKRRNRDDRWRRVRALYDIPVPYTYEEIATTLGLRQEQVKRDIREMRRNGWLIRPPRSEQPNKIDIPGYLPPSQRQKTSRRITRPH